MKRTEWGWMEAPQADAQAQMEVAAERSQLAHTPLLLLMRY